MRSVLADVNLWLATLVVDHPHHAAAVGWWRSSVLPANTLATSHKVAFCRVTQLGVLRLLTNQSVMGSNRKTIDEAWQLCQLVLSREPVQFVPEPKGIETILAEHCQLGGSSRKFWTDGYLAAFAKAAKMGLATFDRDFKRYPNLDLTLLA